MISFSAVQTPNPRCGVEESERLRAGVLRSGHVLKEEEADLRFGGIFCRYRAAGHGDGRGLGRDSLKFLFGSSLGLGVGGPCSAILKNRSASPRF